MKKAALTAGVVLALSASAIGTASAQDDGKSGGTFLRPCRDWVEQRGPETFVSGLCAGIVGTLFQVGPVLRAELAFCPPEGTNIFQATRVVIKYIETHPERRSEDIEVLAANALRAAWPCRRQSPGNVRAGQPMKRVAQQSVVGFALP